MMKWADVKAKSDAKLNHPGLNPIVREKGKELVKKAYDEGVAVCITQTVRTTAEQNALYRQGRFGNPGKIVTWVQGGYSFHNHGLAIDFALYTPDGRSVVWNEFVDYDKDGVRDWYEVVKIAKSLGFTWGGDWQGFRDAPHFQMDFGLTCQQLINGAKAPTTVASKPASKPAATKAGADTHTVVSGDTLSGIAIKYKTTVKNIQTWNKLKGELIKPKQVLLVKAPAKKASAATSEAIVPYPGKPLYKGQTGMDAKDIKRIENAMGLKQDGKFDDALTKAIKAYQKRKGLGVDGVVGEKSWNMMF